MQLTHIEKLRKGAVHMKGDNFIPKTFAYCNNYNTLDCPESNNIQEEFCPRIEPLEIKEGEDYPEAVDIGRTMIEISRKYCQNCSNFLV